MRKPILLAFSFLAILMASCQPSGTLPIPERIETASPTPETETKILPSPTVNATPTYTATPILTVPAVEAPTATSVPAFPVETGLKSRCIEIAPSPPEGFISEGVAVMESTVIENGRLKPELYFLDMKTGVTIVPDQGSTVSTSLDRKFMAYVSGKADDQDRIIYKDLVISNGAGQRLEVLPWESGWYSNAGWIDDYRLLISLNELDGRRYNSLKEPSPLLVLDPFTGERQILYPDFDRFLDTPSTLLPYWEGVYGIRYDPTATRAVYPIYSNNHEDRYTYALWDVEEGKLAAMLDNVIEYYHRYNNHFPPPVWSPDGSHFVLISFLIGKEEDRGGQPPLSELFRVSRDGEVAKLTHFAPHLRVQEHTLSWSPDERYISMYLNKYVGGDTEHSARLALLDTETLEILDTCIDVHYYWGMFPITPIWSPDGSQFLVVDFIDEEHSSVILVDVEQNYAVRIAEDMRPAGWLVIEP